MFIPVEFSEDKTQLEGRIRKLCRMLGESRFKEMAAKKILEAVKPHEVVPSKYALYRPIVKDGVFFLLSRLSIERLISLAADLILDSGEEGSSGNQLITFARAIPTLHKLGQIIARNPHLDSEFKKWLVQLENGLHDADSMVLHQKISDQLGPVMRRFGIRMEDQVLSEASVAAVLPFVCSVPGSKDVQEGVFKVIKPGVREKLTEEFAIIYELANYFETRKHMYELKQFRFLETFRDIREALSEEIYLSGEQVNLKKAARFYESEPMVHIPEVFSFSTNDITAMEKFPGDKITEFTQNPVHRRRCARILFRSMICHPLFSRGPQTLFHGDPHAGNIFGFFDKGQKKIRIALLDWSQAGELFQKQREEIHRLFLAIASGDLKKIHRCIENLSEDKAPESKGIAKSHFFKKRRSMLREILSAPEFPTGKLMEKAFFLIDQSAMRGVRYPKNLLMFRKAFFTLQGVIYDLDPKFDMDRYMTQILSELFVEDLPARWWYFFFPVFDNPGNYRLAVSNVDLENLFIRMLMESGSTLVSLFCPPKWSYE